MEEVEFKPFHETYSIVSLAMSIGILYPNPKTEKWRRNIILLIALSVTPVALMLFYDIHKCWNRRDIANITRHSTVFVPCLLVLSKIALMYKNRIEAKQIIDEINQDHESFNFLPEHHKNIIRNRLYYNKMDELAWAITVVHSVFIFPLMAAVSNIYSYMSTPEPKRFMIHDLNIPFTEPETRFESPYYEIMFVYMFYCCGLFFFNFIGYDGFFGLAINHTCLKMELYCQALIDAMEKKDGDVFEKIVKVINAQNRVFRLVKTIQKTFNFWLGTIFVGTVIHVCNCLFQIMEGFGLDFKYIVFIIGSVIHIYLPCRHAAKLKSISLDTASRFYCSGWERDKDLGVRKIVTFMIARAQIPANITAFNMLTFDMELFVSILHTSYSMFTLLRS